MKNKFVHISFVIVSLFFASCTSLQENSNYEATGIVRGLDMALCACCGSMKLEIDNDDRSFRVESFPESSGINDTSTDVKIKFDWTLDRVCQSIHYIKINKLEKL